jgi:protein arginine kinase
MRDVTSVPNSGLEWLDASGPHADIVLSTRIRLARNLAGVHFGLRASDADRQSVLDATRAAAESVPALRDGVALEIERLAGAERQVLIERHLVSRELIGADAGAEAPAHAALLLGSGEGVGVLVNEEDHLRLQSLQSGFRLHDAWRLADTLDEQLGTRLRYAFHGEYGFLTSCPTNVGTGMRASVLMHLPGLVLTQEIAKVLEGIGQVGLTFRGLYGEGSEVVGNFFQISNQTTLGKSEEELIDHLEQVVERVIQYERQARAVLQRDAPRVIEDKVWRAYGLLRYARTLSFEEAMNLLSGVRLGVSLKLLPGVRVYTLNQIMIFAQSAHLEQSAGRPLSTQESDAQRAAYVRRTLAREGEPPAEE